MHFCTLIFVFTNWVKIIVWGNGQIELNLFWACNIPVRMLATMFLSVFSVRSNVMESFDAILKGFTHYIRIILPCSIRPGNIWLIVLFTMTTWCVFHFMNSHNRGALLTGEGHAFCADASHLSVRLCRISEHFYLRLMPKDKELW